MATIMRMPGVSADASEATITEWLVGAGAPVRAGQPVATVETAKAEVELTADEDGVLHRILAEAGVPVPVGDPLAVLLSEGEGPGEAEALLARLGLDDRGTSASGDVADDPARRADPAAPPEAAGPGDARAGTPPPDPRASGDEAAGDASRRLFASPIARRIARDAGVDLAQLSGTGPGGRITRRDVERAVAAHLSPTAAFPPSGADEQTAGRHDHPVQGTPAGGPAGWTLRPASRLRTALARALTTSQSEVPHFYLRTSCRVDGLLDLRERLNHSSATRISINDILVKATGRALADVPSMNVTWASDGIREYDSADIAVAMNSARGLVAPVVRSTQSRSITDISRQIADLRTRAEAGQLKQSELEGGSFSVSNLGMYGVEEFAAVIPQPCAGILAVGAITREPVLGEDDRVVGANILRLVLSVDHRPVDGALAAQWLARLKTLIEEPVLILM